MWSVAIRTKRLSPLGYHVARGWVLPAAALSHPSLKEVLEDPTVTKCVHNQAVDDHAIHNHGVNLVGCVNTLGLARWVWPELISQGGFGLKNLMQVELHRAPICEFVDVVRDRRTVQVVKVKRRVETHCTCGVEGCRLRKDTPLNEFTVVPHVKFKVNVEEPVTTEREEEYEHPLKSIVPGHPRWDLLVRYSAEDAIAALEIHELATSEPEDPAPFVYNLDGRPPFSQGVENEIVLMERVGFRTDTEYAAKQAIKAEEDELAELVWLHRWFVLNAPTYGPHRREDVDDIWGSPKQKAELFDALGFPASPVWKKGRVKPGQVKMDGAALEWIAKNHKPAKQLIEHLLHLQRIRSGKKYLIKLRDCGGFVNPICGPAGDSDDRNGAVTGRLGIKGVLEAQQLPSREEADLYQIRKAVIA